MHPTFICLALAMLFLNVLETISAQRLSRHEYRRHINVLENIGRLQKRQSNETVVPGQLCVADDVYSALQAFSSEAYPFCSSFLSIANYTSTTAFSTVHT